MKTHINPYLHFNGQCREALTFYNHCLGGELSLQQISESPMAAQMPSEAGAQILHGQLTKNDLVIMGSDMAGSVVGRGSAIALCLNCSSDEEVNHYFERLSQGGVVKTPLHQTFWGATYGELTDRYGIQWMFNFSKINS